MTSLNVSVSNRNIIDRIRWCGLWTRAAVPIYLFDHGIDLFVPNFTPSPDCAEQQALRPVGLLLKAVQLIGADDGGRPACPDSRITNLSPLSATLFTISESRSFASLTLSVSVTAHLLLGNEPRTQCPEACRPGSIDIGRVMIPVSVEYATIAGGLCPLSKKDRPWKLSCRRWAR